MRIAAAAKVNLHLRVGLARDDGFHPLLTWMATIGLFDTLDLQRSRGQGIQLVCDGIDSPADPSNLVCRAGEALIERMARPREGSAVAGTRSGSDSSAGGALIKLTKRIPVGAGLGGGSADAARTLAGLNDFWRLNLPVDELSAIAATLGSDVPFFLQGPSAVCCGRGEIIRPIDSPKPGWLLLICPPFGCSTPAVYRAFDQLGLGEADAIENEPDWSAWTRLESERLLPLLVNDLEPAAFVVQGDLGKLRERLERRLARIVRMSGSGSSLFTLYDDQAQADEAAGMIVKDFPDLRVEPVRLCPQQD